MYGRSRRLVEWSLLVLVLLVVVGVFGRQFRVVQGQGEMAAIKTTLGALRTAFVIDYLKTVAETGNRNVAPAQRNPFLLLDHIPANYAGKLSELKGQPVPPGSWVFDAYCNCIGYEPMYPQSLETADASPTVWFRISALPAPFQITPVQSYVWQGEVLN
jgi:hypothetical protein